MKRERHSLAAKHRRELRRSIAIAPEAVERVAGEPHEVLSEAEPKHAAAAPGQAERRSQLELRGTLATRDRAWLCWLGVSGGVASGPIPAPAIELAASLEFGGRHWSVGLEPRWLPTSKTGPQSDTSARAKSWMIAGTLAPCYRFDAWQGCLLGEFGRLSSTGEVAQSKSNVSAWMAPGIRLAYRMGGPIGLSATAKLDGLYGLNRITLVLNERPVYETERLLVRLHLEVAYGF